MPSSCRIVYQIVVILLSVVVPLETFGHGRQTMEEDTCASWIRGDSPGEVYKVHVTMYQIGDLGSGQRSPGGFEELCREIPEPGEVYVVFDILNHELRDRTISLDIYPVTDEENAVGETGYEQIAPESKYTFMTVPDGTMYVTQYFKTGSYKIELIVENLESIGNFDFTVGSKNNNSLIPVLSPGTRYMLVIGILILVATVIGHRRYLHLRSTR